MEQEVRKAFKCNKQNDSNLLQTEFLVACRYDNRQRVVALLAACPIDVHAHKELAFRLACKRGCIEVVRILLQLTGDRRVDVHSHVTFKGYFKIKQEFPEICGGKRCLRMYFRMMHSFRASAFILACSHGRVEVVQALLDLKGDRRIDVHERSDLAFILACANGHLDVARYLLSLRDDRCFDSSDTLEVAFMQACSHGLPRVVELLLSLTGGRRVHKQIQSAFLVACEEGHTDVVRTLLGLRGDRRVDVHAEYTFGRTAFQNACRFGRCGVVRLLLHLEDDRRIDVHANQNMAFRLACKMRRRAATSITMLNMLLSLKGDRRINVHANKEVAFSSACGFASVEVVEYLLRLEGDRYIDVHAHNERAFRHACMHGRLDVVKLLLSLDGDRRVDVHAAEHFPRRRPSQTYSMMATKKHESSAFSLACAHGHPDVARFLLRLEGDRRIDVHEDNDCAFRRACKRGSPRGVEFLLSLRGEQRIFAHTQPAWRLDACVGRLARRIIAALLLSSGADRLPSAATFQSNYLAHLPDDFPKYEHWLRRIGNRPEASRVLVWRAAVNARKGMSRIKRCCEEGRPMELDRCLHLRGAIKLLDKAALQQWREVASLHGHGECVKVLNHALRMTRGSKGLL
jgi:ankyrin repeat protein